MTDKIKNIIAKFPLGFVFTTSNFSAAIESPKQVNKILNNRVKEGIIRKLSKVRFYKPQISKFGELPLDTYQVVKDLIEKDGKLIGYLTGYAAFNDLGLTTQVPATLQIGTRKEKKAIVRGIYRIRFVKQENTITKENILLLRLLDCLRFFKEIPDTMPDTACHRLLVLFQQLSPEQIVTTKRLALKYNPAAIALLGAILEKLNPEENTAILFKKLNTTTVYNLNISQEALPTQKKWNIR